MLHFCRQLCRHKQSLPSLPLFAFRMVHNRLSEVSSYNQEISSRIKKTCSSITVLPSSAALKPRGSSPCGKLA